MVAKALQYKNTGIDLSGCSIKTQSEIWETRAMQTGGGYAGARSGALRLWRPFAGSADTDTVWDLPDLRAKSRDMGRNNPIGSGALRTDVIRVIGTGLSMQPRINRSLLGLSDTQAEEWEGKVRERWEDYISSQDCDAERKLNGYGLQVIAERSPLESGDMFVQFVHIPGRNPESSLAVKLIEADRIMTPPHRANGINHMEGIDLDANGAATGAWICNKHPGDMVSSTITDYAYVPFYGPDNTRYCLQVFGTPETLRPQQTRGVPWLAPVIEPLKQLARFTEAELQAAVNNAIFSMFIEMESNAFNDLFSGNDIFNETEKRDYVQSRLQWEGDMTGGKAVNLLPGEKVHDVQPTHPNAGLDPFMQAILKQVGPALGLPPEVLTLSFNASYSAARASLLSAWQTWRFRRENAAAYFCQPWFMQWLYEQVAIGKVQAPGFMQSYSRRLAWSKANWIGDGPGSIDPAREIQAAQGRVDLGISNRDIESVQYDGIPWSEKFTQLTKEQQLMENAGLIAPAVLPKDQVKQEPNGPGGQP
jgi:lambda family phage portal protein